MKTSFINLTSMFIVETGRTLVYELDTPIAVFNKDGELEDYEEYSFSREVVDVCTGKRYGWDGSWFLHLVGNPVDTYVSVVDKQRSKRGRRSCSNNKKAQRAARIRKESGIDDLPF